MQKIGSILLVFGSWSNISFSHGLYDRCKDILRDGVRDEIYSHNTYDPDRSNCCPFI